MSALTIRGVLRRHRRDLAVIATVVALAGAIAAHHSGLVTDMQHDSGMVEMCLGVFTAVGAAIIAVGLAVLALVRWRPALIVWPASAQPTSVPVARARHGPAGVRVLCVSRR